MEFKKEFDFKKMLNMVFDKLKTDDVTDYEEIELDKNAEVAVEAGMKETYDETIKMFENANSLEEALAHLSQRRRELIKSAFRCQSFHVDIQRQIDGTVNLLFESVSGSKLSFLPSVVKLDESNYDENDKVLIARIVLEIITLVLSFIGVGGSFLDEAVPKAMKFIIDSLVSADRVIADIKAMVAHVKEGKTDLIAGDIIAVLVDLFAIWAGPVIRVIKILIQNLSWFSIIIIVCQALCFITITVLSGGAAILAKVISWVMHASFFIHKLIQKNEFDAITFSKN